MQNQGACMEGLLRRFSIVSTKCIVNSGNVHQIPLVSPVVLRASILLHRGINQFSTGFHQIPLHYFDILAPVSLIHFDYLLGFCVNGGAGAEGSEGVSKEIVDRVLHASEFEGISR